MSKVKLETESAEGLPGAEGEDKREVVKGEFQICKMKKFWRSVTQQHEYT